MCPQGFGRNCKQRLLVSPPGGDKKVVQTVLHHLPACGRLGQPSWQPGTLHSRLPTFIVRCQEPFKGVKERWAPGSVLLE